MAISQFRSRKLALIVEVSRKVGTGADFILPVVQCSTSVPARPWSPMGCLVIQSMHRQVTRGTRKGRYMRGAGERGLQAGIGYAEFGQ